MENLLKILVVIHVLAGIGALIFGAMAIFLKNNTPKHKPIGKLYFWCMTIIFVTGLILSIYKELLFLFFIAIFTYYATLIAYRSLRLKKLNQGQKPLPIDWVIECIAGLTFIGLIVFAIYFYYKNHNINAMIPLFFGLIGSVGVYKNVKRLKEKPKETMQWLKVHIGNMCGSYIGAITAFVVNQSEHIPLPPFILWLGPTFIIVPVIIIELKKIKTEPIA